MDILHFYHSSNVGQTGIALAGREEWGWSEGAPEGVGGGEKS